MIAALDINYNRAKLSSINGRYVTCEHIDAVLEKWSANFQLDSIGTSVQKRVIKCITLGSGPKKILMWSQMHGNESTTTKAVLDVLHYLDNDFDSFSKIKNDFTIKIIPILNPDGAFAYSRANANGIDLNRDAQDLSQPESKVLRAVFDDFGPDFCFNLHDQRTIFNVGETQEPATVSFLSPAFDETRGLSAARETSMKLIVAINQTLQKIIPGKVGRYDDSFNPNCVGDAFQMTAIPTILFEAGHFPRDYDRKKTREFIFRALWAAIKSIKDGFETDFLVASYFDIPENNKKYFDILVKNANHLNSNYSKKDSIGILFTEILKENSIHFEPMVENVGDLTDYFGHVVYDCSKEKDLKEVKSDMALSKILNKI
ncbi:M14 family metallopeptidase [Costertonia aggregata]|uniref:Peptidase M14 n=1 Tax=Costertonia aggregata TaxID=343403 RepID=A0A7H9AUG1_9FLAO|nr:M14 metallopeptidase family protein [Costertonia aggregata]QLG47076.1 peptidase M14 [Costertonia aggregata]